MLYGKGQGLTPDVPERDESTYEPFTSIRTLSLDGSILTIDGIGLIQGMDFTDLDKISQQIRFIDLNNSENVFTYDAECIDSEGYSKDDGWNYQYTGFSVSYDLKEIELPLGSYYVKLKTVNEDRSVETALFSSLSAYRILTSKSDTNSYQIKMNDSNAYRFEIDVMPLVEELDFTEINKPSKRTSNVSLDNITLDEDGTLTINGHAYMYYIDYDDTDKISYDIYLVDSDGNYLKLDTELYDDGIDYKSELNSNYNINNISFLAAGKIDSLNVGEYVIYLKMSNTVNETRYEDINEIKNYGFEVPSVSIDGKTYEISAGKIRKRLTLNVSGE